MIGYFHDNVVCLSVCLSVTKCIVANRYILQQKCGKFPQGTGFYNFQPRYTDYPLKLPTPKI